MQSTPDLPLIRVLNLPIYKDRISPLRDFGNKDGSSTGDRKVHLDRVMLPALYRDILRLGTSPWKPEEEGFAMVEEMRVDNFLTALRPGIREAAFNLPYHSEARGLLFRLDSLAGHITSDAWKERFDSQMVSEHPEYKVLLGVSGILISELRSNRLLINPFWNIATVVLD